MTSSQVQDQTPEFAALKQIAFGPYTLDGYMCDDSEFRMSINSTARAIGCHHMTVSRLLAKDVQTQSPSSATDLSDSTLKTVPTGSGSEKPVIIALRPRTGGAVAHTINIATVVHLWGAIAKSDNPYAQKAFELVMMCAGKSLEERFKEEFNVRDSRSNQDRLIDWYIKLDPGAHEPIFGGAFAKHFARVTGVSIGHPYAATCMADLVYFRLPQPVYETMQDLNPQKENGWREFTYSQIMTDELKEEVRKIVMVVTSHLAAAPSKDVDKNGFKRVLHTLDKTMPRFKTRRGLVAQKPDDQLEL